MNIVFYLLIISSIIILWFCLTFAFKSVGGIANKIIQDTVNVMTEEDPSDE